MRRGLSALVALVLPAAGAAAAPATIAAMKDHRRVLLIAAPTLADPRLAQQRAALAGWRRGARDRDLTLVVVARDRVEGAGDRSAILRRRWHLPPGDFQAVLIGKDGHEALRARRPLSAHQLQATIDAMPMRRVGQR